MGAGTLEGDDVGVQLEEIGQGPLELGGSQ
jgi:hypothetical protein